MCGLGSYTEQSMQLVRRELTVGELRPADFVDQPGFHGGAVKDRREAAGGAASPGPNPKEPSVASATVAAPLPARSPLPLATPTLPATVG